MVLFPQSPGSYCVSLRREIGDGEGKWRLARPKDAAMLDYRPARRRHPNSVQHRNYAQREPFIYGSLLSDYMPRRRPTVHRERPLQECLVQRKRPPLPKERSVSRSMVAEFLKKKRERERRSEECSPQDFFGKGSRSSLSGSRNRNKSATGYRPERAAASSRISVSACGERKPEFSIIQALIDEVLPCKPGSDAAAAGHGKQHGKAIASPPISWPIRPASAPFRLSPQNMAPDHLAETLATKKKNFLRKRPATAPPNKPVFHLPLSKLLNGRRSSTPNHHSNDPNLQQHSKVQDFPVMNRKASVHSSSASASVKTDDQTSELAEQSDKTSEDKSEQDSDKSARKALSSSTSITSSSSESKGSTTTTSVDLSVYSEEGKPPERTTGSHTDDDNASSSSSSGEGKSPTSSESSIELPTPSTLNPDSIEEWLRNK